MVDVVVSAEPILGKALSEISDDAGGVHVYRVRGNERAAEKYDGANAVATAFGQGPVYPGWSMVDDRGAKIERFWELALAMPPGSPPLKFVFEPFSFRLGLFLSLIGVGAICCTFGWNYGRRTAKELGSGGDV